MLSTAAVVLVVFAGAVVCEDEPAAIIKQINRVNEDGTYTFGYEAADGSFKIETRDVLGNVKGMFGFIDENGELKRVSYTASNGTGFRATPERASRPVVVGSTSERPAVIQHIPRRGEESNTTPNYATREPTTPRPPPLRVLVTRRPLQPVPDASQPVRRQLYPDPRDIYRNALLREHDLKPDVPRYYEVARPALMMPYQGRALYRPRPRILPEYEPPLDLEALRDEIMNYILDYLQYRSRRYFRPIEYLPVGGGAAYPGTSPVYPAAAPVYPAPAPVYPVQSPVYPGADPSYYNQATYYPRNLPLTPGPNVQYSQDSTRQTPRTQSVRSVEILGSSTTQSPTTRAPADVMQATS